MNENVSRGQEQSNTALYFDMIKVKNVIKNIKTDYTKKSI